MVRLGGLAPVQVKRPDGLRPRAAYAPEGSWDLYKKDGARLGVIQPGPGGQPSRLIIESPKGDDPYAKDPRSSVRPAAIQCNSHC